MAPGIGRSIGEGFRAANKSWPGIVVLIGCLITMFVIAFLGIQVTNPPWRAFEQAQRVTPAASPTVQGPAPAPSTSPEHKPQDLFSQMDAAKEAAPAAKATATQVTQEGQQAPTAPAPATPAPVAPAPDPQEQARRQAEEWFGHAWPIVLACVLFVTAANLWLSGGQIGYLAKIVTGQSAALRDFWSAGGRAFVPLLLGTLLSVLANGALRLMVATLSVLLALLGGVVPLLFVNILSVMISLVIFAAIVWLVVRVSFWFIAIVTDQLGPVAGLWASFRATRGRFWRTLGLVLVGGLIFYAVLLLFLLVLGAGGSVGGVGGLVLTVVAILAGIPASAFAWFGLTGALIRFYEDVTSSTMGGSPPAT